LARRFDSNYRDCTIPGLTLTLELRRAVHRVASGSLFLRNTGLRGPWRFLPFQAGVMFWFSRKKFVGSYLFLIALSRS
jgi:hypothetical protein